jgi:general secretion pathway protein D
MANMKNFNTNEIYKLTLSVALMWVILGAVNIARAQVSAGTSSITPSTQQIEIGPVLDVIPDVLSDGYTINLTLIPSLVEFEGYAAAPSFVSTLIGSTGNSGGVVQLPTALPAFSVRQVVTTVNIWDNQTVVLGGLISSSTSSTKDKIPVLGDIPWVGNLFQSSSKTVLKKNLMIFVTATIVDPAGNRVHSDDELPFAQTAVPVQQPGAGVVKDAGTQPISTRFVQ